MFGARVGQGAGRIGSVTSVICMFGLMWNASVLFAFSSPSVCLGLAVATGGDASKLGWLVG